MANEHVEQHASGCRALASGATGDGGGGRRAGGAAVSQVLGEKLLQGWTMLDASCVTCGTPLMSDARGTVLCVVCHSQRAASNAGVGVVDRDDDEVDNASVLRRASRELGLSTRVQRTVAPGTVEALRSSLMPVERGATEGRSVRARGSALGSASGGVQPAALPAARRTLAELPAPAVAVAEEEHTLLSVDDTLALVERDAAEALGRLRVRLRCVSDVEALRACLAAIRDGCDAVRAARAARALPRAPPRCD